MFDSWFAKGNIVDFLKDASTQRMKDFSFAGIGFSPKVFPVLAGIIDDDKISVEFDSKLSGQAAYDYASNTLVVGFTKPETLTRKALLVHECTHAIYDCVRQNMNVQTSESIAYIAQCMYARLHAPAGSPRLQNANDVVRDEVFKTGWEIAGSILDGKNVSLSEQTAMISAVSKHPFYSGKFASSAGFDGV
jgi:hypothetical protein